MPSLDFTAPELPDISPDWAEHPKIATVTLAAHVPNGNMFCLRLTSDSVSGCGACDEGTVDGISLTPSRNLPAKLTNLTARVDGDEALLTRQTDSVTNNAGYHFRQRSGGFPPRRSFRRRARFVRCGARIPVLD